MAEDSVEGSAYLRALKRLDDPAVAAAPAPESPAADGSHEDGFNYIGDEGNSGARFKGAEKRRSHRYKCEGKAELREEGRDVRTWATFRDVSLHGCYIEVQATYPVGTILQKVETKGVVRVNYPYLGMGIAFREMSEPSVARLRELLSRISRRTVGAPPRTSSALASGGTLGLLAQIADPTSALRALAQFFENRQTLMRDDFLSILRKSQNSHSAVKA
jgi:PilZ domain-containing protein